MSEPQFTINRNGVLEAVLDLVSDLVIPEGVTAIGYAAFWGCENLESITIPASVTTFGDDVFKNCPKLVISAPAGSAAIERAKQEKKSATEVFELSF